MKQILGALLIDGAFAIYVIFLYRDYQTEIRTLTQLEDMILTMIGILSYRDVPVANLFAEVAQGECGQVLDRCVSYLEDASICGMRPCMQAALRDFSEIPEKSAMILMKLATSVGKLDKEGQLMQLKAVYSQCQSALQLHLQEERQKLRTQGAMCLGCGAVVSILLL